MSAAASDYERAIELDGLAPDVFKKLADLYMKQGKTDKAAEILEQGAQSTGGDLLRFQAEELPAASVTDEILLTQAKAEEALIPQALFDNTYWNLIFSPGGGGEYRALFHSDGTYSAVRGTDYSKMVDWFVHIFCCAVTAYTKWLMRRNSPNTCQKPIARSKPSPIIYIMQRDSGWKR